MRKFIILEFFISSAYAITSLTTSTTSPSPRQPVWNYNDELSWPGARCKNGGRRQSPIDIDTSTAKTDYMKTFIKNGRLKFTAYDKVLLTAINNGHTIQFTTEGDASIHPKLTGGPLNQEYRLEQIHFHWISEHAIDGNKFPLEIHLVHIRSDLSVTDALKQIDGLAIIAVFCKVTSDLNAEQEEITEELMQYVSRLQPIGTRLSGVLLDVSSILSPNTLSYYTYYGSLTSPECNEAVVWIIFDTPIYISDTLYQLFLKTGAERYNFRSEQTPRRHAVYRPPINVGLSTPYVVKTVNNTLRLLLDFFKNVTNFMTNGLGAQDT